MSRAQGIAGLVGLLVVSGLPLLGHWLRRQPEARCALDGVALSPLYRVRILDQRGTSHAFCCVVCAELWCRRHPGEAQAIYVTDEATGEEVEAASAYFVRSLVVTTPPTQNRIHTFRSRADAERHADAAGGTLLDGAERPFGGGP
jgi:hypothetical protein